MYLLTYLNLTAPAIHKELHYMKSLVELFLHVPEEQESQEFKFVFI